MTWSLGFRGWHRLVAFVGAVGAACTFACSASAAPPPVGGLEQLPGAAHCYTPTGSGGACTAWLALEQVVSIAITPDGRFAYVASGGPALGDNGTILLADRNPQTGALTPVAGMAGCYSADGSSPAGAGTCTVATDAGSGDGQPPFELDGLAISSDGRFLYAASSALNAIVSFSINPSTGALTQLPLAQGGCVNAAGSGGCAQAFAVDEPESLTLSPDGTMLYESSYDSSALLAFQRDTSTGAVSQVASPDGCATPSGDSGHCEVGPLINGPGPIVVSADGGSVDVAMYGTSSLVAYSYSRTAGFVSKGCVQDPASGGSCPVLAPLNGAYGLARSPDGNQLYVGLYGAGGVTALSSPFTGTPGVIGCTLEPPFTPPPNCASGDGLTNMNDLAVAPDGAALYGAAGEGVGSVHGGMVAFARDGSTGALTQYPGAGGCQLASPPASTPEASCGDDPTVTGPYSIAVSPDSNFVYAGGFNYDASGNTGFLTAYYAVAAPTCQNASVTTGGGQSVTLPLTCTDVDGNPMTVSISGSPAHGSLGPVDQTNQTVAYTPAAGYSGSDSVTFTASDGTNTSAPATVRITVTPPPPSTATLSSLRVSPRRFVLSGRRVGGRCVPVSRSNRTHKRCTRTIKLTIRYRLSAAAAVTFKIEQLLPGRRVNGSCRPQTRRNRHRPRCARTVKLKGKLVRAGKAGSNSLVFHGRIGSRKLKPGTYKLVATPAGGRSTSTMFTIAS